MAITATFNKPDIFTTDNPNIITMFGDESLNPNFYYRVETFKGATRVGVDKVFVSNFSVSTFDMSIYTRYLLLLDQSATFSVKITEVKAEVDYSTITVSKVLTKGYLSDYDSTRIKSMINFFLTDFKVNDFNKSFTNTFKYSFFAGIDFKLRITEYDASGTVLTTNTSAIITANGFNLNQSQSFTSGVERIEIQILSDTDILMDTLSYQNDGCSKGIIQWRNAMGAMEYMAVGHNIIDSTDINGFDYEGRSGRQSYLKTWRDGGTIYTQDLSDKEQLKVKSLLQSPSVQLYYTDEFEAIRVRDIIISTNKWELNQQFFEDTKAISIAFQFQELNKSLLL